MSDIVCVTNRRLCGEEFLTRMEKIAMCRPAAVILREKDLSGTEYEALAVRVAKICGGYNVPCILHGHVDAALRLGAEAIHLPLPAFRDLGPEKRSCFEIIGVSCHSPAEAREAEELGCTYLTAGHIYDTDCKKGSPGRGLSFLRTVCDKAGVPVLAIGGINAENIAEVRAVSPAGICVMSGVMQCADVRQYLEDLTDSPDGV